MSGHTSPSDPKKFTVVLFTGIVVAFVFTMLMMLWQGDFEHDEHGERHYNTTVVEPGY